MVSKNENENVVATKVKRFFLDAENGLWSVEQSIQFNHDTIEGRPIVSSAGTATALADVATSTGLVLSCIDALGGLP